MASEESAAESHDERGLKAVRSLRIPWQAVVGEGERAISNAHHQRETGEERPAPNDGVWTSVLEQANRALPATDAHLADRDFSAPGHSGDAFQFVLGRISKIGWLTGERSSLAHPFRVAAQRGTASVDQAIGRLEARIAEATQRPPDLLEELGASLQVTKFVVDLRAAATRLRDGDCREAVGVSRSALEIAVKEVANRLMPDPKDRPYGQAVEVLAQRGLIHRKTVGMLNAKDVSVYGWTSAFGTHRDDTDDTQVTAAAEASLAIDWVRAVIRYLLEKLASAEQGGADTVSGL